MKKLLMTLAAIVGIGAPAAPASKLAPEVINPDVFKASIVAAKEQVAASQVGSRRVFTLNYDRVANSHELARMAEEMGCEVHYSLLHINIAATNGPTYEDTRD